MRLLLVEDDLGLAKVLQKAATEAGYRVRALTDGSEALGVLKTEAFDLILLDGMLPGLDGVDVCRMARAFGVTTPILFVTARDTTKDKVEGLDAGADDYIVKPFQVAELLARMRALLRRGAVVSPSVIAVGDLTLDGSTRLAHRDGKSIRLSATEYTLLEYLMRNAGRVLTRSMLLDHVWEYDFMGNDNVLDVYVSYLRAKIDKGVGPRLIHTVRGVGYQMESRE